MAEMQKKMAAALAAVNAYLQDEEARTSFNGNVSAQTTTTINQPSMWGQSGRQEMMNMRNLIQMRAFERCR